ncbi:MAG: AIPR family protein [Verrucomicrobiales bacterium]|nr:AIPR family protein [Verrucomicrobiales bacterium]
MDIVTDSLLKTFQGEESLHDEKDQAVLFEHFANFCALANDYGEEFDVEDIHTGGGDDLGIDGISVIVNGALVLDVEEIEDLADTNKHLDVEFLFVQAKSGENFSGTEISNFFYGVKDIFSTQSKLPRNQNVSEKEKLLQAVYARSSLFKKGNPAVRMYYVTAGKWQDDEKLVARIDTEKEALFELNIFDQVEFTPVDARCLQRLYKRAKNRLSKTVDFLNKVTLPSLEGVQESYLGFLSVSEYLKLITDEAGGVLKGLFYDNVRDFQGENPVNKEIDQTLRSPSKELFVLMNNGVTIVADSISRTGDTFTIEDYQIVNGCQTSHVIYNNRDRIDRDVYLPIKLIVSQDSDVKNKIIKATNRQTPVKTEELTALTDFQKTLEDFYSAITGDYKLYYERRSQQYRSSTGIEKIRIVSVSNQIRSFASMFLVLPHQASRYYGTLLKTIDAKIFVAGHPPVAYYASALTLYRLEALIRRKTIDNRYRPFKYHLLALVRIAAKGEDFPPMTSNKFERYCKDLVAVLSDDQTCLDKFITAIAALDKTLAGDFNRDRAKDASLLSAAAAEI